MAKAKNKIPRYVFVPDVLPSQFNDWDYSVNFGETAEEAVHYGYSSSGTVFELGNVFTVGSEDQPVVLTPYVPKAKKTTKKTRAKR